MANSMVEAWLAFPKSMEKSMIHSIQESAGLAHICDSVNIYELVGWSLQGILELSFEG